MSSGSYFHPSIVKLTSENYLSWKEGIHNHCLEHDLLPYLLEHVFEPRNFEQKNAWLNSNDMVYGLIFITIYKVSIHHIAHTKFPFIAWTIVQQLYENTGSSSKSDISLEEQACMDDTKISIAHVCVKTIARKCYIIIISMLLNLLIVGEMISNLLYAR